MMSPHKCVHLVLFCCVLVLQMLRVESSLIQLAEMVECSTGHSAFDLLGYGCYCGEGNKGGDPVDDLDACCMAHDHCYDYEQADNCGGSIEHIFKDPYVDSYKYQENCETNQITCLDKEGTCERRACECDRAFALCTTQVQYQDKYAWQNIDYSRHCAQAKKMTGNR